MSDMHEMTEKKVTKVLFSQLEEALEEREGSDRRQQQMDLPDGIDECRRKGDRRASKKTV